MDLENPVIKLCMEGSMAEYKGRIEDAGALFSQAWEGAGDDYEASAAAHYMAHYAAQYLKDHHAALYWNQEALKHANAVGDEWARDFYPSFYMNLGHAHEIPGNLAAAEQYYTIAAGPGLIHQDE